MESRASVLGLMEVMGHRQDRGFPSGLVEEVPVSPAILDLHPRLHYHHQRPRDDFVHPICLSALSSGGCELLIQERSREVGFGESWRCTPWQASPL